jgi:hypothetical protein
MPKLSFSAQLLKVTSKVDRTLNLTLNTQEMGDDAGKLTNLTGQQLNILFVGADEGFKEEDIPETPLIEEDGGLSPSRRQRSILFKIWEAKGKPMENFEVYYRFRMSKNEHMLKDELDNLTL